MDTNHSIGELLSAGAAPSADEAKHLAGLGAFASQLYARHLHGQRRPPVDVLRATEWAAHVADRLGAATATRWAQPFGMAGSMLSDAWRGYWQIAQGGVSSGYEALDYAGLDILELYEDAPEAAAPVENASGPMTQRGSLFGPRAAARPAGARRASRKRADRSAATERTQLRFADGSSMAPAAADAVEAGGLLLADQVGHFGDVRTSGALTPIGTSWLPAPARQSGAAARPFRSVSSGLGSPVRQRSRGLSLDGLMVDQRTPALASALTWAEAAFGDDAAAQAPMALTSARIAAMFPGAEALAASPEASQRPVFAFFDAVEGEFLSLTSDAPAVGAGSAATAASTAAAPTARPSMVFQASAGPRSLAARTGVQGRAANVRASSTVQTSLDRLVHPAAPAGAPLVRPLTQGVFPTALTQRQRDAAPLATSAPQVVSSQRGEGRQQIAHHPLAAQLAERVTFDAAGRPRPHVQRTGTSAPRLAVRTQAAPGQRQAAASGTPGELRTAAGALLPLAAMVPAGLRSAAPVGPAGSSTTWRSAADLGPDLPLGASLTGAELMAGTISLRRSAEFGQAAPFAPIASAHQDLREPGARAVSPEALDGVSWVSLPFDQAQPEARGLSLAAVPSGRRAAMVPSATALRMALRASAPAPTVLGAAPWTAAPATALVVPGDRDALRVGSVGSELAASRRAPLTAWQDPAILPASVLGAETRAPSGASTMAARRSASQATFGAGAYAGFDAPRDMVVTGARGFDGAPATGATAGVAVDSAGAATRSAATGASLFARMGAEAPAIAEGRTARNALRRPVATAREALAVAPLFASGGSVALASQQATAGPLQAPSLSRTMAARQSGVRMGGASPWMPEASAIGQLSALSALTAPERNTLARQLSQAGWTQPELAMLQLGPAAAPGQQAQRSGATAGARAAAPSADIVKMVRNLARVLTGSEALAARPDGPHAAGARALAATLTSFAPRLATEVDSYFGALAPPRQAAPRAGGYVLADALGELVALARGAQMVAPEQQVQAAQAVRAGQPPQAAGSSPQTTSAGAAAAGALAGVVPPSLRQQIIDKVTSLERFIAQAKGPGALSPAAEAGAGVGIGARAEMGLAAAASPVYAAGLAEVSGQTAKAAGRPGYPQLSQGMEMLSLAAGATLEGRVAAALGASTRGPAGVERLAGPLRRASVAGVDAPTSGAAVPGLRAGSVQPHAASAATPIGSSGELAFVETAVQAARSGRLARTIEQQSARIAEPMPLSGVLAPEAMLGGMATTGLKEAPAWAHQGGPVGELTQLGRSPEGARGGEPQGAGAVERPSPVQRLARILAGGGGAAAMVGGRQVEASLGRRAATASSGAAGDESMGVVAPGRSIAERASVLLDRREAAGREGAQAQVGGRFVRDASPVGRLLSLIDPTGGRSAAASEAAANPRAVRWLLSRLDRRERSSVLAKAGGAEFALAWLGRIDGSLTGLDLGMEQTRSEIGQTFGPRSAAGTLASFAEAGADAGASVGPASVLSEASLVAPESRPAPRSSSPRADRSGLRRVASAAAGSGGRARQAATAAVRRVDYGYVNTGSAAAAASRVDVSRLTETALSSGGLGRTSLPLVAPAMKAVAQSALLSSRGESAPASTPASASAADSAPSSDNSTSKREVEMGPEELKKLAVEMADRVSRLLRREKERRGIWA